MAELEWRPTDGGYAAGLYRIQPLDDGTNHHWRLTTVDDSAPDADFRTLSVAFVAAVGLERARIRRARALTHLAVGVVAGVVAVFAAAGKDDLPAFVVMMGAIWLAVWSFGEAMSEHLGDAWDWTRAPRTPRRITPFDRAWAGVVDATRTRVVARISVATSAAVGSDDEPKVRILPPE